MILFRILFWVSFFLFYHILYFILGRLFFMLGFRKVGHALVAMSIAGDFGLCKKVRKWLFDNCPRGYSCDECKLWTCDSCFKKDN